MADPFRPIDDDARALARDLIDTATHAALAVLQPDTGLPSVSRIAFTTDTEGMPMSLMSELSVHTAALSAQPTCALLVGAPGDKGDPLTHPRLTLHCLARFVSRDAEDHAALRDRMLMVKLLPGGQLVAERIRNRILRQNEVTREKEIIWFRLQFQDIIEGRI